MKKVVRTVWISLLTGLAFLVACTTTKGLSRAEKKQLKSERAEIISHIDEQRQRIEHEEDPTVVLNYRNEEYQLRQRLSEINSQLGDRQAQEKNGEQMGIILNEIDSLQNVIDASNVYPCLYGPPANDPSTMKAQRRALQEQLDQLMQAIQRRENSCVYGSPEVIQRYSQETRRMRQQAEDIIQQIKELDEDGKE